MDEKRKEEINEKLDNIDWYHENISEIMESFANSPAEVIPDGKISDDHYQALEDWLE